MRKTIVAILAGLLLAQCAMFRNLGGGDAKANAVQALITTTRSATLLMTAAAVLYDFGAFGGPPGNLRADDVWKKISDESIRIGEALESWETAIKANKDASAFQSMVAQALAVIGALLPPRKAAALVLPALPSWLAGEAFVTAMSMFANPNSFRSLAVQVRG